MFLKLDLTLNRGDEYTAVSVPPIKLLFCNYTNTTQYEYMENNAVCVRVK